MKWEVIGIDEQRVKCPLWQVCGGAIIQEYLAMQKPRGHPQSSWIAQICCDENAYLECRHYQIRNNVKKGAEEDETR